MTDLRPAPTVPLFVNGEGMRGGSVHRSIAGHPFLGEATTAPRYRFFSVADRFPALWPVAEGGVPVPGEVYDVPLEVIRDAFIPAEPPELELSVIELSDGSAALARTRCRDHVPVEIERYAVRPDRQCRRGAAGESRGGCGPGTPGGHGSAEDIRIHRRHRLARPRPRCRNGDHSP